MKSRSPFLSALVCATMVCGPITTLYSEDSPVAIIIHGGAGYLNPESFKSNKQNVHREVMTEALKSGHAVLKEGGSSLDAVVAAILVLEDSPLFNAGKGAVFTNEGRNELDASIMDGKSRQAGAVGGVTTIKNPITAARAVMDKSKHVFMAGPGAEKFAGQCGLELVSPEYFRTDSAWKSLERARKREKREKKKTGAVFPRNRYLGTVGAVAIDKDGNIAAGTSTGGLTNKKFGRIGDSPVIGAGTYADNDTCGISCTGHGEYFIRHVAAYDVAARMKYAGASAENAADKLVHETLLKDGGRGGMIGIDRDANVFYSFNTPSMTRGSIDRDGKLSVAFFDSKAEKPKQK